MMERDSAFGVDVDLKAWEGTPVRALLFGEAQGRIVVSTKSPDAILSIASQHDVRATVIGRVGARNGTFRITFAGGALESPVARLADAYHDAIPRIMTRVALATAETTAVGAQED